MNYFYIVAAVAMGALWMYPAPPIKSEREVEREGVSKAKEQARNRKSERLVAN